MSNPALLSFNGGVISPLLSARTDIEKYKTSCQTLDNMIPMVQGSAIRRAGTKFIDKTSTTEDAYRLIPFARSKDINYILNFSENEISVISNGSYVDVDVAELDTWVSGQSYIQGDWVEYDTYLAYYCITSPTVAQLTITPDLNPAWEVRTRYNIWTPFTAEMLPELQVVQSYDAMYITSGTEEVFKLSSIGSADFTLEKVNFTSQAFKDENVDPDKTVGIYSDDTFTIGDFIPNVNYPLGAYVFDTDDSNYYVAIRDISEYENYTTCASLTNGWLADASPLVVPIGSSLKMKTVGFEVSADDIGKHYLVKRQRDDNSISEKLTAVNDETTEMSVYGSWNLVTHGTWDGTIELQRSYDGGTTWVMHRTYSSTSDRNVDVDGEEEEENALYKTVYTVDNSGSVTIDFNVSEAYYNDIYLAIGYEDANTLIVQNQQEFDEASRVFTYIEYTTLWAEGAWGGDYGYPSTIGFYEQRLWFGGNDDQPLTLWSSKTNDYENLQTGVLDSSALILTLSSTRLNRIEWLAGQTRLLVGTSGDEWAVGATSSSESITPENVVARVQSTNGSEHIQPIMVDNNLLYVQRGGRKIQSMIYDYKSETYESDDVTSFAENVTKGKVIQLAYQENPHPILWCLKDDGNVIGFTYERKQEVFAWHTHDFGATTELSNVKSIAVDLNDIVDNLYIDIIRSFDGSNYKHYIEYMQSLEIVDEIEDSWYLDSALAYDGGDQVNVRFTGQTSSNPYTFDIADHGFVDGDKIRIVEDLYYTTGDGGEPNAWSEFPYKAEVFTVSDVVGSVFKIKNEPNSDYVTFLTFPTPLGGGFKYIGFEPVTKTLGGLTHLYPLEVSVIGDNTLLPNETVNTSSEIILDQYVNTALVGLPMTSTLKPMDFESELADGSSQPRKKRISQAVVQFYKTLGATVQDDDGSNMVIPFREASDAMDKEPALYTGQKKVKFKHGYDTDSGVTVLQNVPFPMNVLMISVWMRSYN